MLLFSQNIAFAEFLPLKYRHIKSCKDIQKRIDTATPHESILLHISGFYRCEKPLIIDRNDVMLVAMGIFGAKFILAENANSPVIIIGNPYTPIKERRSHIALVGPIVIDGNMRHQQYECWGGACDTSEQTTIRNNGITIRGADHVLMIGISVRNARSGGIVTEKESKDIIILNSDSSENFYDGFAGCQTEKSILCGIHSARNYAAGLSFDIGFSNNIICDARIENNFEVGVFLRDSSNNHFFDIMIEQSGKDAIFLTLHNSYEVGNARSIIETCPSANLFEYINVIGSGRYGWFSSNFCPNNLLRHARFSLTARACIKGAFHTQPENILCNK